MLRRLVPATAVAGLLLAGLTGCGAQQATAADCEPTLQPGALSDSVTVLGGFGETPEVSAQSDVTIRSTQRTVVDAGDPAGLPADGDALVGVNMAFYDTASGDQLYASPAFTAEDQSAEYLIMDPETVNPLTEAVRCSVPGDRVVVALGPEDSAALAAQLGGSEDAAIVGVMDVVSTSGLAAAGSAHGLPNGFPAVVTDETGRPGIVLPPSDAPAGTRSAVRIDGDGDEVTAEDGVIGQVMIVGWDGSVSTNSWNSGVMSLGTEEQIAESGYDWRAELTGATIGSQVVIVQNEGDDASAAQVVIVDILAVN